MKSNSPSLAEIAISRMLRAHRTSISHLLPGIDSRKYTAALIIEGVPSVDLGIYRFAFGDCECHAEVADRVLEAHQANQLPLPSAYTIVVYGLCNYQPCNCGQGRTITYSYCPETACVETIN